MPKRGQRDHPEISNTSYLSHLSVQRQKAKAALSEYRGQSHLAGAGATSGNTTPPIMTPWQGDGEKPWPLFAS